MYLGKISTNDLKKSIKILMNWSCLNWINKSEFVIGSDDASTIKLCPLCNKQRDDLRLHLLEECAIVNAYCGDQEIDCKNSEDVLRKCEKIKRLSDKFIDANLL